MFEEKGCLEYFLICLDTVEIHVDPHFVYRSSLDLLSQNP